MITSTGIEKVAEYIKALVSKGTYTISGVTKDVSILKTELTGGILTIYLYLDNTDSGNISNIKLIDIAGSVFADKPDNITKTNTKGLLIAFKFTISEV
ncbi:MAG: hypothetical protein HPY74_05905 [Firmicutes bacterium]|nr:hypothetical protein [Bacillota bacterium]